jgi:nicotinamide-nucleotide amidase
MIVEVVAVGTELLIGQIINSNVATIGQRLADEGFDAHYQVTVGDNLERLADAIRTAASRADAVILTGGIGPTQDDMTREALCLVGGREMVRDEAHAEAITRRLMATRGSVSQNVLRMADYPEGSEPLPNGKGVALGVAMEHEGTLIFAMPGVPREMIVMLDEQVLPRLRAASGEPAILKSRVLRTWGYGESQVSEILDDLYESTNPSVAFLINASEVRIRISAKAETAEAAEEMISRVETVVLDRLGDAVFGRDEEIVEVLVVRMLAERGWRIAAVEAATLGMVGTRLAETPGGVRRRHRSRRVGRRRGPRSPSSITAGPWW